MTLGQLFSSDANEIWAVVDHANNNCGLCQYAVADTGGCWVPFSSVIYWDFPGQATGRVNVAVPPEFFTGRHVVRFSRSGTERIIEVDGVDLLNATSNGSIVDTSAANTFVLGSYSGGNFFGGIVAFVTVKSQLSDPNATIVRNALAAL